MAMESFWNEFKISLVDKGCHDMDLKLVSNGDGAKDFFTHYKGLASYFTKGENKASYPVSFYSI